MAEPKLQSVEKVVIKNDTSSYFAPQAQPGDYIYAIFALDLLSGTANLSSSNWLKMTLMTMRVRFTEPRWYAVSRY